MRLSKKHIGRLFDVHGADGSWVYQLVDIKNKKLLFSSLAGKYWTDNASTSDWRPFKPQLPSKDHIQWAWMSAREIE